MVGNWKHPVCLSLEDWISGMKDVNSMENYACRTNKPGVQGATWIDRKHSVESQNKEKEIHKSQFHLYKLRISTRSCTAKHCIVDL